MSGNQIISPNQMARDVLAIGNKICAAHGTDPEEFWGGFCEAWWLSTMGGRAGEGMLAEKIQRGIKGG